jgi:acetyl-CoA C-acetyltransferase
MVADDMSNHFDRAVSFKAGVQVNDFLPMSSRDILKFEGPAEAFRRAFREAKIDVSDLDFAEVHDCFTIAELLIYEAMGLAKPGRGSDLVLDGTVHSDGALPINLSGGLKAKGHPVGATGVSMHALTAAQISGEAGTLQKEGASLGCIFNMGGSGVANYCSILENAGI